MGTMFDILLQWVAANHDGRAVKVFVIADEPAWDPDAEERGEGEVRLPPSYQWTVEAHERDEFDGNDSGDESTYVERRWVAGAETQDRACELVWYLIVDAGRTV